MNEKLNTIIDYVLLILSTTVLTSCIMMQSVKHQVKKELNQEAVKIQEQSQQMFHKVEWSNHSWIILLTSKGVGLEHDPDCACGDSKIVFDM